jgi:hypothetical protein
MPTSYTIKIPEGISFKEFALDCTKAFIRGKEPNDYHDKGLVEDGKRLLLLQHMSVESAGWEAIEDFRSKCEERATKIRENEELAELYHTMLNDVIAWEPPTDEHKLFKKFMMDQLEDGINECDVSFYDHLPRMLTGDDWLDAQIESVEDDIAYHISQRDDLAENWDKDCKWLESLEDSLPTSVPFTYTYTILVEDDVT